MFVLIAVAVGVAAVFLVFVVQFLVRIQWISQKERVILKDGVRAEILALVEKVSPDYPKRVSIVSWTESIWSRDGVRWNRREWVFLRMSNNSLAERDLKILQGLVQQKVDDLLKRDEEIRVKLLLGGSKKV
jgi:hypothetical protein